jgi:hypothetical protein
MSKISIAVLTLLPLAWGCSQHSREWDDAWAQCQSEAIEQMETAGVAQDQRSEWQENYIRECMQKKDLET